MAKPDGVLNGRSVVVAFLRRKWDRELDDRSRKELWGFRENRMAVAFFYEWHHDSINDAPISEGERQLLPQ
jgi:nuclear transport factor 2 (NTF2) superfamily protein